jgi:peptide/nickel transport system permease protein
MGIFSGYVGGWVDSVIARSMDVFLAFPLLVFAIALIGVIPASAHFGPVRASGLGLRDC